MASHYTVNMAMARRSVIQYYSTKIRLAKEAGITATYQQLLAVWNELDVDLREFIDEPEETTTMDTFR
jgi:hypothetical protein